MVLYAIVLVTISRNLDNFLTDILLLSKDYDTILEKYEETITLIRKNSKDAGIVMTEKSIYDTANTINIFFSSSTKKQLLQIVPINVKSTPQR